MQIKTESELAAEDLRWAGDLNAKVEQLRARGATEEELDTFAGFYGGPPSVCHNGTCNCPMH